MFGKGIRLPFNLAGIPLFLDFTFLLLLPLLAWLIGSNVTMLAHQWGIPHASRLSAGATPWILGFIAAVGLVTCVVLHELGHSLVAKAYGVRVRSITLWFLGGVARFDEMPRARGVEAVIAIAGPIVSVVLAIGFWALLFAVPMFPALVFILAYLAFTNLLLALFNLIPAIPLDGGRVLRSLLALVMRYATATRVAAMVSKLFAIAMGLFAIYTQEWYLLLVAVFVFMAGSSETRATQVEDLLQGAHVGELMNADIRPVSPDLSAEQAAQRMIAEHRAAFPVVDENQNVLGVVTMESLSNAPPETPVRHFMATNIPTVRKEDEAFTAFRRMSESGFDLLAVTDGARHLLGILTRVDLVRLIEMRSLTGRLFNNRGPHAA